MAAAALFAQVRGAHLRVAQQLLARAGHGDDARLHDVAAVGDRQRAAGVLLDQQHRHALGVDVAHDLEDLVHHDGREAHGGLVEQQQLGLAHERARHGEHLLLAAGHGAGELVAAFLQAREQHEHALDVGGDAGLVLAHERAHLQVLGDGHAREHAAPLGHHHQALLHQVPGALAADALALVQDVAVGQPQRASDGLHGRRLARAVGADERDQLARAHIEIDALDGLDAAVAHLQAAYLQEDVVLFGHAQCPPVPR